MSQNRASVGRVLVDEHKHSPVALIAAQQKNAEKAAEKQRRETEKQRKAAEKAQRNQERALEKQERNT